MKQYIDRGKLLRKFIIDSKGNRIREVDVDNWEVTIPIRLVKKMIREADAADVVERSSFEAVGQKYAKIQDKLIRGELVEHKRGEWVMTIYTTTSKRGRVISNQKFACSECGYSNGRKKNNFCPNCGADMREELT